MNIIDRSKRSIHVNVWAPIVLLMIFFLMLSSVLGTYGYLKYNKVAANSSFPIGSEIEFPVSKSKVELKNIYTDKNKDVMIIQLSEIENTSTLPYRGTDFRIFMHSKSLEQYEKVDILFGRMSTDGDLFLVIPKPTDDVYTLYILNTKDIQDVSRSSNDTDVSVGSASEFVDEEGDFNSKGYARSMSKELSSYTYYGESAKNKKKERQSVQVGRDDDMVALRVTLDPAFKQSEYQPTVINEELLKEDNSFDFETFFNVAFQQTAINDLEDKYNKLNKDISEFEKTAQEYKDRIDDNPDDTVAEDKYNELRNEIANMENEVSDVINKMEEFKSYEYDEDLFKYINTEAYIVPKL